MRNSTLFFSSEFLVRTFLPDFNPFGIELFSSKG